MRSFFTKCFYRKVVQAPSLASSTATAPTPTKPDTSSLSKSTMSTNSKPFKMNKDSKAFVPKGVEPPKLSLNSVGFQPTLKKTNKTFVPVSLSKTVDPTQRPTVPVEEPKVSLNSFLFSS